MLIAIILDKKEESKFSQFEEKLAEIGFEKIGFDQNTVFIGTQKHQIRCVIKKNAKNNGKKVSKIITDEPKIVKLTAQTFNASEINVR